VLVLRFAIIVMLVNLVALDLRRVITRVRRAPILVLDRRFAVIVKRDLILLLDQSFVQNAQLAALVNSFQLLALLVPILFARNVPLVRLPLEVLLFVIIVLILASIQLVEATQFAQLLPLELSLMRQERNLLIAMLESIHRMVITVSPVVMAFIVRLNLDTAVHVKQESLLHKINLLVLAVVQGNTVVLQQKSALIVRSESSTTSAVKKAASLAHNIKEQILLQEVLLANAKMDF